MHICFSGLTCPPNQEECNGYLCGDETCDGEIIEDDSVDICVCKVFLVKLIFKNGTSICIPKKNCPKNPGAYERGTSLVRLVIPKDLQGMCMAAIALVATK